MIGMTSNNSTAGRDKNPAYVSENRQKNNTNAQISATEHTKLRYQQCVNAVSSVTGTRDDRGESHDLTIATTSLDGTNDDCW